jgi:hypothetical protein
LLALGGLLALLGSVHGPALLAYFVLGYLVLALALLWISYGFIRRRGYRHGRWLLIAAGILLCAAMVGGSQGSWGLLIEWESARQDRLATATQVFHVHDEPLLSPKGDPIGIRLRYSMRFPNSDYFWHSPSLRIGKDLGTGMWADGRFTEPAVTPPMQRGKSGALRYEKGRQYDFTAEVIPYFLVQDKAKTKLCIVEPLPEYRAGFERLIASGEALHYKITVTGTKFEAETENAYSPKTFYESALKEGAVRLPGSGLGGSVGSCQ